MARSKAVNGMNATIRALITSSPRSLRLERTRWDCSDGRGSLQCRIRNPSLFGEVEILKSEQLAPISDRVMEGGSIIGKELYFGLPYLLKGFSSDLLFIQSEIRHHLEPTVTTAEEDAPAFSSVKH